MKATYSILILVVIMMTVGCAQSEGNAAPIQQATGGQVREFTMTAKQFEFNPATITVDQGDTIKLRITSLDVEHGFALPEFGVSANIPAGETVDVQFVADKTGTFTFSCNVFCGEGHQEMKGQLIVQ